MATEPEPDWLPNPKMDRRTFGKTVGVSAGVAWATSAGQVPALAADDEDDGWGWDDVGAVTTAPQTAALGVTQSVWNWAFGDSNEYDAVALREAAAWDVKRYHNSVDNMFGLQTDLLEYTLDGVFEDAKLEAISALNGGLSQSEVEAAALDLAKDQLSTLQKNMVEAGNQAFETLFNYSSQAQEAGIDPGEVIDAAWSERDYYDYIAPGENEFSLIDGSTVTEKTVTVTMDTDSDTISPLGATATEYAKYTEHQTMGFKPVVYGPDKNEAYPVLPVHESDDSWTYDYQDRISNDYLSETSLDEHWNNLINSWENDLKPDIQTWVANAYDAVSSGEIEPDELLSRTNLWSTISEDEPANRALADLRASGIPVGADHPMAIETTIDGATVNVTTGLLGSTGTTDEISQGDVIDPAAVDHDYIMNFYPQDVVVEWPYYETQIDGGTLTLTDLPGEHIGQFVGSDQVLKVRTTHAETVTVNIQDQWGAPPYSDSTYTVDLTDQLDDPITEVEYIDVLAAEPSDTNGSVILENDFEVVEIEDADYLNYEHDRQIHTADNYVTADEWEQRNEVMKEILDELQEGDGALSGGGGWLDNLSLPSLGIAGALGSLLSVVFGGVVVFIVLFLFIMILAASG